MAKKKTIAGLANDCATHLQKLVRLKAADHQGNCRCVTCGKVAHWKEMQGGHFIERGKLGTKLIEENIHPQCPGCNLYGMKKASVVLAYYDYMREMYGADFIADLKSKADTPHKFIRVDLEVLKKELAQRVRDAEQAVEAGDAGPEMCGDRWLKTGNPWRGEE